MTSTKLLRLAAAVALVVAACSSSTATPAPATGTPAPASSAPATSVIQTAAPSSAATPAPATKNPNAGIVGGKLVIDNASGSTWTCQFNPFNAAVNYLSIGFMYEPLIQVNTLKTNADGSNVTTPWLATATSWNSDYTKLTATIRDGVKWSDGEAFSANDVLYTFNAMKADAGIDINALWDAHDGPLTDVELAGTNQVVFTFKAAAQTYFYYVVDQTPIVAQHIYGKEDQKALENFADKAPVGTGPYTMSTCSQDNIKYLRNAAYWQSTADKPVPQVAEVDYPAFLSNDPANLLLSQGGAQWGGQYVPNIDSYYISKDSAHRHYWFPPTSNVTLFPNLKNALLSNLAVRQAISWSIDRASVSKKGESGYEPASNQTGVVLPTFQSWYDQASDTTAFDVAKAAAALQSAGFKKGSDGIWADAKGAKLKFTIKTVSGYTDWDASLAVVKANLKAAGIDVTIADEDSGALFDELKSGKFELGYWAAAAGPLPYYELRNDLFSGNIGSSNFEQFKDATVDDLLNKYASSNAADQMAAIKQIEAVMGNQVPIIPITEGVDWYQYDTKDFGGWPTQDDPYCQPAPWNIPDNGMLLTRIYPTH